MHSRPSYSITLFVCLALWGFPAKAGLGTWSAIGPTGGNISHLVSDPTVPAVLYASAETGLFRSENRGETWAEVTALSGVLGLDATNPQILYLGTAVDGIQKSTDRGETWQSKNTGLTDPRMTALALDPTVPGTLYAGAKGGLFKSTDGAETWAPLPLITDIDDIAVRADNPQIVYAVTDHQIQRSTDGGGTWSVLDLTGISVGYPTCIEADPQNPLILYTCTTTRVAKSLDGGDSWAALPDFTLNPFARSVFAIGLDPNRSGVLMIETMDGSFRSTDGGLNWASVARPIEPFEVGFRESIRTLLFDGVVPDTLYAGTNRGVYQSLDLGQTWNPQNTELRATVVRSFAVQPGLGNALFTQLSGSLDGGVNWFDLPLPRDHIQFHPSLPMTLYTAGFGGVYRTSDLGIDWTQLPTFGFGGTFQRVAIDAANPQTVYAMADYGVAKTIDGGATWTASNLGWPFSILNNFPIAKAFPITESDPDVVFVAAQDIRFARAYVIRSVDGGVQWQILTLPFEAAEIHDLVIHPNADILFAATSQGLYRSLDLGDTWTFLPFPFGSDDVRALAAETSPPYRTYAGLADGEVFVSLDPNDGWVSLGIPAPGFAISTLEIDPDDPDTLYAGTEGRSAFVLTQGASALVSPSAFQFGRIAVGDATLWPFEVRNQGTVPIEFLGVDIYGDDSALFDIPFGNETRILDPGQRHFLLIDFRPLDPGAKNASASFRFSEPVPAIPVPLSGEGSIPDLVVTPETIVFPPTPPGKTTTLTLAFTNAGATRIHLYGFQIFFTDQSQESTAFNLGIPPETEIDLDPGQTFFVPLVFSPSFTGQKRALLSVPTDSATTPLRGLPITGTATVSAPEIPTLSEVSLSILALLVAWMAVRRLRP